MLSSQLLGRGTYLLEKGHHIEVLATLDDAVSFDGGYEGGAGRQNANTRVRSRFVGLIINYEARKSAVRFCRGPWARLALGGLVEVEEDGEDEDDE